MSICKYISNGGLCLLHGETFYKEPCIEGPCHDYTAMTNAEHIRTMTDVKMAELFADVGACFYDDADVCEKWNGACDKCWRDWMKHEVDFGVDIRGEEG